jgi:hypothetical protein
VLPLAVALSVEEPPQTNEPAQALVPELSQGVALE